VAAAAFRESLQLAGCAAPYKRRLGNCRQTFAHFKTRRDNHRDGAFQRQPRSLHKENTMRHVGNHIEITEEEAKAGKRGIHVLTILSISASVAALLLGVVWIAWSSTH
jgi:hypothetical protein